MTESNNLNGTSSPSCQVDTPVGQYVSPKYTIKDPDNIPGHLRQGDSLSAREHEQVKDSRNRIDRIIVDAKKLKANLVAPQDMLPIEINNSIKLIRTLDDDNEFFHFLIMLIKLLSKKFSVVSS